MERIHRDVEEMDREESYHLTQRIEAARTFSDQVTAIFLALCLVVLFSLGFVFLGIERTLRSRQTALEEAHTARAQLAALAGELQQRNTALEEFTHVASHDLKEPLRKIQTFGGMLRRKAGDDLKPEHRDYVDKMIGAADRMQALIQALLDYTRVTTKSSPFVTVDLKQVADEVLQDLEVRIAERQGRVIVSELPTISADPVQMRQLFQNLIANALKYHREGVPPVVRVTGERASGKVILRFMDNGMGFTENDAERIFQIFERLDGRSSEGSGVGLSICKKIVERHGGTIIAQGKPGEGATFIVEIPIPQS